MTTRTYLVAATALAGGGAAFSGYLSAVKLWSGVCAFNEPCPMFLGQPACFTGFAIFATMLLLSAGALLARTTATWPVVANGLIAALGVVYAGTLTITEVVAHAGVPVYGMGLPTCAYGLVFFAGAVALAVVAWRRRPRKGAAGPAPVRHLRVA